MSFQMY